MKCPNCVSVDLIITERQTVEIDYCPTCRGVWLDRGELDKILERSHAEPPRREREPAPRYDERPRYDDRGSDDYKHGGYHPKRKKSWLEDIFD